MLGDGAFYYLHGDRKLVGAVLTHVNELILTGNEELIQKIRQGIAMVQTVSKIDKDKFRFTGQDIERCADGWVRVSMNDYTKSMARRGEEYQER